MGALLCVSKNTPQHCHVGSDAKARKTPAFGSSETDAPPPPGLMFRRFRPYTHAPETHCVKLTLFVDPRRLFPSAIGRALNWTVLPSTWGR